MKMIMNVSFLYYCHNVTIINLDFDIRYLQRIQLLPGNVRYSHQRWRNSLKREKLTRLKIQKTNE